MKLTLALLLAVCCNLTTSYYYNELRVLENEQVLDVANNVIIRWTVLGSTREIEIELQINTIGWLGFAFRKGTRGEPGANADLILAGYDDQRYKGYIEDRFVDLNVPANVFPASGVLDDYQSVKLLSAKYQELSTIVRFLRKLDTGDEKQDNIIKPGPNRVAWSFATSDNTSVPHSPGVRGFATVTFYTSCTNYICKV